VVDRREQVAEAERAPAAVGRRCSTIWPIFSPPLMSAPSPASGRVPCHRCWSAAEFANSNHEHILVHAAIVQVGYQCAQRLIVRRQPLPGLLVTRRPQSMSAS
jgi:hypothetical protein